MYSMSVNCCVKKIPKAVKNLLQCDQKVVFKGSYDLANIVVKGNSAAIDANICENKHGYNIFGVVFNYVQTAQLGAPVFISESYNLSSYTEDLTEQKGIITFTNLYNDSGSGGISKASIHSFNVLGSNGIYKGIKNVIIDFTNPVRQLYFCT